MNSEQGPVNLDQFEHWQHDQLNDDEEDIAESGAFIWGDSGFSWNYEPSTSSSHETDENNVHQDSTRNGQSTVIPLPWKPSVVEGLTDQVVAEGEELVFQVKVQGEIKKVKWRKDGQPAKKNSRVKVQKIDSETYRLTITKAELSDAGEFQVQIINDVGRAVSSAHAEIDQIPKIVNSLVPAETDEYGDVVFRVEVSVPVWEVKWYKNGQEIKPSSHFQIRCCRNLKDFAPKKYKLEINKVGPDDEAIYKVILSNKAGSCESEAALTVNKTVIHKNANGLKKTTVDTAVSLVTLVMPQSSKAKIVQPNDSAINLLPPLEYITIDEEIEMQVSSHNSAANLIQKKQRKRTLPKNDRNKLMEISSKRY
ncbi:immunoglobulin i-set domain-containing protein [Ditylenchus destructor]|uniref:Immunoglobulin i-set domain-containing protein n=1 Tax=Ditylenchus destructor TaxID=166010 RepID=A0AAD4QUG6_9BILA|nr:immunoglobulin i-set domain-containing protein [Ditylenchus destructor]